MRLRAWHEAARLRHQHDQRGLPHIGRLTCHIRSCDQKQARVTIIQISVVGHKQTVTDHLLNDRMSALDNLQFHRSIHNRFHVAKLFTDLREGRQNIQLRDRRGGLLNGFHIALDFLSHTDKKLVFQLIDLGLRIQNQIFHLLQLRRNEAFRVGQRLFANVVFGNQIKIGFGNFQIITKHPIVADLQVLDAGALALGVFEIGNPLLSILNRKVQMIQFLRKALLDQPAFFDGKRRVFTDRAVDHVINIRQTVNHVTKFSKCRALHEAEITLELRQHRDGITQRDHVSAVGVPTCNASDQTFKIVDVSQIFSDIAACEQIMIQFLHTIEPLVDLRCVIERFAQPLAHFAAAHGGTCLVEDTQKRPLYFFFVQRLGDFQIAHRRLVQRHARADFIMPDMCQMLEILFLCFKKIVQQRAQSTYSPRAKIQTQSGQRNRTELRFDCLHARFFGIITF